MSLYPLDFIAEIDRGEVPSGETVNLAELRSLRKRSQLVVEPRGIEPLTSSLRTTRSPN